MTANAKTMQRQPTRKELDEEIAVPADFYTVLDGHGTDD